MKRFVEGEERTQLTFLPGCLDDYVSEDNPVRAVDAFVEELDLKQLGFAGADPAMTGRPAYHPAVLLKIAEHLGVPAEQLLDGPASAAAAPTRRPRRPKRPG